MDPREYTALHRRRRRRKRKNLCQSSNLFPKKHISSQYMIHLLQYIFILISVFLSSSNGVSLDAPSPSPAGFIDFDNLPITSFSCDGKVIGGYYADVETGCQMFHVCTLGQKDEVQDIKFLCLNGTVFDQETRVCERVDEVDCSQAEKFYDLNLDLYVPYVTTPKTTEEPLTTSSSTTTTSTSTTTSTTTTTSKPYTNSYRPTQAHNSPPKGFSSFAFFQRNPQNSVISSGYNSQLRQSYLINHNEETEPSEETLTQNPTGRKVPSTEPYNMNQNVNHEKLFFTSPKNRSQPLSTKKTTTTTTTVASPHLDQDEDSEYYEDSDYADSEDMSAHKETRQSKYLSSSEEKNVNSLENTSVAPLPQTMPQNQTMSKEYYDDYGETSEGDYYDDEERNFNPNEHHFSHVDVPRIPYAKPNVPRVLVTNGKPFLPRLRRQSHHYQFNPLLLYPNSQVRNEYNRYHQVPQGLRTYF